MVNKLKLSYITIISALSFMASGIIIANEQEQIGKITVYSPVKHDVSIPLKDITIPLKTKNLSKKIIPLMHAPHLAMSYPKREDGALQITPMSKSLLPLFAFPAIGNGLGQYVVHYAPADANGSVGLRQYVQAVNADFAVFDKYTGQIAPGFPKPMNSLWAGFGGVCESANRGQPIIKYDQLAHRWVITQAAYNSNSPYMQCIAISKTEDATGEYYRYAYQFSTSCDEPKLTLWPDAYYMTFLQTQGTQVCAADRNKMLTGKAATIQCQQLSFNTSNILTPVDLEGPAIPPIGTPSYFMSLKAPDTLLLFKMHVDFNNAANTTFIGPTNIAVAYFTPSCSSTSGDACAIQPYTTNRLDTLSDRLMHRVSYRQFNGYGAIVATHTVEGPAPRYSPAIRFYELRFQNNDTYPAVYQQVTHAPDSANRYIGSIAMDKLGNIAIGYTISTSLIYPSLELASRNVNDPINTLNYLQPLVTGYGSQIDNITRWGDYNSMSVDPSDDCTFWYTNQYLKETGSFNWSTYVVSFKLAGCQ